MQKNNLKVETEGKEIAIRNSHGDIAIIPIKDAGRIKSLLNDGCNTCIDEYVKSLPSASQYAQDGGVYPKVETTKLNPAEESSYQTWRTKLPKNLQYEDDYDLRGFYKENPKFDVNDPSQHLTDKYKLPNHPTFSNESMYYKGNENYGGTWKSYDYGDIYTPNNPETKQSKVEWRRGFDSKDKVVVNGKLMDIKSPEYKEAYSKGIGYFDSRGVFITSKETLPEVVIKSKIAKDSYADYKNQFLKTNPSDKFYSQRESEHNEEFYSAPLWAQQAVRGYSEERKQKDRKKDEEDYNKLQSNFIAEKLLSRNKKKDNETRVQWLQRFSNKELEAIKNSDYKPEIESSTWSKFEQGLLSVGNAGSPVTFKNNALTQEEAKKEDNPLNILQPLNISPKLVQSFYKKNYSLWDALKGKKNNAGIVEDIVTDPLNLVGVGLAGKLSKADKVIDATKAGSRFLNKTDDVVKPIVSFVDDVGKQASKQWQLEELPGLHLKSTMEGQSISKIIEPKTGLINIEQALGIIGKESGGANKVSLIRKGLGENIPKKMDYNEFRKVVQDQLIPLEKQFSKQSSNYGISSLGYPSPKFSSFQSAIKNGEEHILKLETQIDSIKNLKSPVNDGNKLLENLTQELKQAKINLDYNKSMLSKLPLENQTLILGNKSKFGRGSSAHGNPDETLGHIHFLRDAETPDVLTVTQIQSDAFQGTHRIMPDKSKQVPEFFKQRQEQQIQNLKKSLEEEKAILNKYKTNKVDDAGYPIHKSQIDQIEESVKRKEQDILFKNADLKNLPQKQLLDKNHQERYLQELVDYAGKRGDINKVRVPTSETAAKVQGYSKNTATGMDEMGLPTELGYSKEHQTILKKYSEQPKTIKKLFGVEPKIVTDSKGNTWYEFDIPKKFKEGKGEIKAFTVVPAAIGTSAAIQSQNQDKSKQ